MPATCSGAITASRPHPSALRCAAACAPAFPDLRSWRNLCSRWSNDIIRSTEHRVVSPPTAPSPAAEIDAAAAGDGRDGRAVVWCPARYSVAFFCNPNWDAVIDCLPGCHSPARPARYPPVRCHDYLVGRLAATYA